MHVYKKLVGLLGKGALVRRKARVSGVMLNLEVVGGEKLTDCSGKWHWLPS